MDERDMRADDQLLACTDRRLRKRDQAAATPYAIAGQDAAAEVEALRRESEVLRGIGQDILDEPVPQRLRDILRQSAPGDPDRPPR
jgi:hypothetical protein